MRSHSGRRVLHSYLTLFLASSPAADPSHDFEQIATRALNTYVLGQHVAPKLQLSRVLRWQPAVNPIITGRPDIQPKYDSIPAKGAEKDAELALALRAHPMLLKSVGLYKVMGEAVQAIVGGTYHKFVSSLYLQGLHYACQLCLLFMSSGCFRNPSVIPPTDITTSPYSRSIGSS